ncbi:MAG: DNA topoisomerase (ATP-hydrolyzing) subunit A [Oscillospiraceae bacterium]|nr:DNA topoisomerase (ATP-hydrolyzing) subunit A [Oscillospiraceae bacterium]
MKKKSEKKPQLPSAYIEGAGEVNEKNIVETLEENYMPYAMSVIVSRALPEIDGFKPSHRKLLYTMYKMGLLTGTRTKSANIVGQTMRLNPHGDSAIYETMVRLARGNESLLHPYVDSKGNFSKAYSRDMAYAASRYTEAKLEALCGEVFTEIERDTVDFVPNYDNSTTEPVLLPVKFPSILVNSNIGIAVSMASNICPFNLTEVCKTAELLMKNPDSNADDIIATLKAPDFPGGGYIIHDEDELKRIYETGRGSVKIRAKYKYDKAENCIEVIQIPPTTTVEAIMDKIVEHVKSGKIKEVSDTRDETDLSGLKLTIDLKRGVEPDALMQKLFKLTTLQDTFSCNFNILIKGNPKVMGVAEILSEWASFRTKCVKRRINFEMNKKKEKLHLLLGLKKILLDIDKAIKIIRETDEENEVVPNLMIGFGIDDIQADYVAEIKLRHINREYIVKRTEEIEDLKRAIAEAEEILESDNKIKKIIISDLREIAAKYGRERKTEIIYIADSGIDKAEAYEEEIPEYPVNIFLTKEGYFKKITPQSLRMSKQAGITASNKDGELDKADSGGKIGNVEHKLKEGDSIATHIPSDIANNRDELLFFTDKGVAYKSRVADFDDVKASVMGDYIPSKLGFDDDEKLLSMVVTSDYSESVISFFENGKAAKVPLASFVTKTKRKKLANSLNIDSPLVAMFKISEDSEFMLRSAAGKVMIFSSALILPKTTRDTQGVQVMRLTKTTLRSANIIGDAQSGIRNADKYRTKTIPVAGVVSSIQLKIE